MEVLAQLQPGPFCGYVAPTGQGLRFLQADAAKRDTSGAIGQQVSAFRLLDVPQAFTLWPYIAHDGGIGGIGFTLAVDFGAYSSSGESHCLGGAAKVSVLPGVTIAAGTVGDQGSLIDYWDARSGGFPTVALLRLPVHSDRFIGDVNAAEGSGEVTVNADPAAV
jgi:hypothetical protein